MDSLEIPVMKDALLASIASFHTKKIIISDPRKFHHYGLIPESMYRCVSAQSNVMADYRKLSPVGPRVLSEEQQAALDALDQPANRGKRVIKKEKEETKEGKPKSSKRKSGEGDSSQSKPKKIKKMANRPKGNFSPGSDTVEDQDAEAENPQVSTREPTPRRSPTPPPSPKSTKIPTPPASPKTTKIPTPPPSPKLTKISTPPPSPKQKAPLFAPTDIPPILTEPTSLPPSTIITFVPVSTIPISTPLITESITTTIPKIPVEVNVFDTGATTVIDTPVINITPSPTPSSTSGATLGGDDEDYDSLYYSPYRIPTDNDPDAPVTSQHIQDINEKLDRLLADSKAYGSVVLKAFLETAIKQYTDAIDKSTKAVDKSATSCSKATKEVTEVVHTTQIFLDSLKAHTDTNAAKYQASVDSFSKTLQDETTKFEALQSTLKEDLIKHQATIDLQKVQLVQAEKEISLLKTQRAVYQSCAGDVKNILTSLLEAHDPFLTLTIRKHLQSKLLPAITILSEMKGVSEKVFLPKQGGEESADLKGKTELKDNLASVSGKKVQADSDSDTEETIAEALKRKKRDKELDETIKVAQEVKNKEEEDVLQCKKTLFPEWDRDTLINQEIEFPSMYWLEPIASFECDNSKDSQFDMPITRKAFTFHCFDVTAEVPHPNLKG
ncbi:uncharacterized protein LOC128134252 [Lactuca sativa]|uniref:uncharacterized protein LOC128134252 n=1 Tax=Lactuca sativa TaxID=4236 RepID=UPI0022AF2832|nr:uncharacterized protein LOC128134252 [Lactuca sativa]